MGWELSAGEEGRGVGRVGAGVLEGPWSRLAGEEVAEECGLG